MRDNLIPTFDEEKALWSKGCRLIAGIDEVGRGALAGPVAAGAVILPSEIDAEWLGEVRDSKLITPLMRERLSIKIWEAALCVGIGLVPPPVIDTIGILNATRLAMKKAIESLRYCPESILIDYLVLPDVTLPQKGVAEGDTRCISIACASIVAKVARDHIMVKFDRIYPGYNFADNKGYCTEEHVERLEKLGPSPIHRLSFHPKRRLPGFENTGKDET
jgi:ribonuclease HII